MTFQNLQLPNIETGTYKKPEWKHFQKKIKQQSKISPETKISNPDEIN